MLTIIIYVLGMLVTAFLVGKFDLLFDDDLLPLACIFWPLFLFFMLMKLFKFLGENL